MATNTQSNLIGLGNTKERSFFFKKKFDSITTYYQRASRAFPGCIPHIDLHRMSWEPNIEAAGQLKHVLGATLSPNQLEREQATQALDQAKSQPDFLNYLLFILANDPSADPQTKASAGINLKNNIAKKFSIDPNSYLLANILKGLFDQNALVRNVTGNVITTLFGSLGVRGWPNALPQLFELVEQNENVSVKEGASSALVKICEDSAHVLDSEYNGQRPLDFMIPKFITLTASTSPVVRANSLNSINQVIHLKTQSFLVQLDEYLQRLFELATDQDKTVRRNVCTAFAYILETRPDKIVPHLDGVINYSLHTINEAEEEVRLEACEFLLALATSDVPETLITPHLDTLVPVLLKHMVYSEVEIELMDNSDDADEEDKDEDIRPTAAKVSKSHNLKEDDEDEDDEDEGDFGTEWNLRKCSAATLDVLASVAPQQVLEISLPILKENITSAQWPIREAAILAFGAVAEGGIEFASTQLPELVPFLVQRLQDQEPPIRRITCWTLGRYSSWICAEAHSGGSYSNYFIPTFQAIIACSLDKKKMVQEGACSSIAQFIENSDQQLIQPLANQLAENFNKCFLYYKRKNLVILYDALQTFVEKVELDEAAVNVFLPPLISKWEILQDDDKELWPLLECMSSVAASLGERFAPFAVQVYQRSIKILSHCIDMDKLSVTDPTLHTPEKDFIISSIDLIDGLIQGLGEHSAELINEHLITLLVEAFTDTDNDVRQSAYALLGDLAIFIPNSLIKHLQAIVGSVGFEIVSRSQDAFAVVNNATWALGEMALRLDLSDYLEKLSGILIDLVNSQSMATVLENAAITIGRMGIRSPEFFAPHLSEFALSWSTHMMYLEENEEKETAFQGMCAIILANPTGLNNETLMAFVNAITMYLQPGQQLSELFHKLLSGYKEMLGGDWGLFLQRVDNGMELLHRYGLSV